MKSGSSISSIGWEVIVCILWSLFGVRFQCQYCSHRLMPPKDHTWMWWSQNSPYIEVSILNPDSTPRTGREQVQFYSITCCKHCNNIHKQTSNISVPFLASPPYNISRQTIWNGISLFSHHMIFFPPSSLSFYVVWSKCIWIYNIIMFRIINCLRLVSY
jgi:hypothetical protein